MASTQPIIVVGRGHSGTRLFANAVEALGINLGASAHDSGDLQERWFTRGIKKIAQKAIVRTPIDTVGMFERTRFKLLCAKLERIMSPSGGAWGWKFPETYLIPWHVQTVYPGARWLEIVRDGRDLAFKEHLTDDPTRTLGRILLREIGALDKPHHVQAALSWAYQVERFESFSTQYPRLVHTVRFEDLLSEPAGVMGGVAAFLGVPMTPACESLLAGSVNSGKKSQFRDEHAHEIREVEEAIRPTLTRYGYELREAPAEPAGV